MRRYSTSEYYYRYYNAKKEIYRLRYLEQKQKKEETKNEDKNYYRNYYIEWAKSEEKN
jgi:hypothetical protein